MRRENLKYRRDVMSEASFVLGIVCHSLYVGQDKREKERKEYLVC